MHGDRRDPVATHDDRMLPARFDAAHDLVQRDHASRHRTPDLHAVNGVDTAPLALGRARDDRQQPRLLREDACRAAARLAKESDDATFEAGLQRLCYFDPGESVAARLDLAQVGLDHLFRLAPVVANPDCPAVRDDDPLRLIRELAQDCGVWAAEARLDAASLAGPEEELLRYGVGIGIPGVEVVLDVRQDDVDLVFRLDLHQELHEAAILALRRIDQ